MMIKSRFISLKIQKVFKIKTIGIQQKTNYVSSLTFLFNDEIAPLKIHVFKRNKQFSIDIR